MATQLELGMISSTWEGTHIGLEEGIRKAKEIGFDTYDIFNDPLDTDDATRKLIKDTCAEVGMPIRSCVCVAFGIVDFNPSVVRFTLDRVKAYIDQAAYFGARNVLLVIGEYFWDGEVFPRAAIWDMAKTRCQELSDHAAGKGIEIVLELEPFSEALGRHHRRARPLRQEVEPPELPGQRRHLPPPPLGRHLRRRRQDDRPHRPHPPLRLRRQGPRRPARPAWASPRSRSTSRPSSTPATRGTVSIELEYAPNPAEIVEWATRAYEGTAAIMRDLGVRD
jgi:hypothetical protein